MIKVGPWVAGLDVVTSLGGYVLLRQLGEGGMGRVFLARHQLLQRDVVIKQIRPHLADRPELVRRFFAEAQAAARLRHPNVVEVIDCAHAPDGSPYLVLEYLDGLTMHDWLTATGPADPTHVALIVAQVASALAVAHAAGIVHRDIKPENLFLMEAPVNLGARLRSAGLPTNLFVKVLDFGIAKLVDGSGTRTGVALGTPGVHAARAASGRRRGRWSRRCLRARRRGLAGADRPALAVGQPLARRDPPAPDQRAATRPAQLSIGPRPDRRRRRLSRPGRSPRRSLADHRRVRARLRRGGTARRLGAR
jgi:serine/threonine protein kinase